MIRNTRAVFLAALAALLIACSATSRRDTADAQGADQGASPAQGTDQGSSPARGAAGEKDPRIGEAYDELTPAPPAEIPILDLYEPVGFYEVLPLLASRADYSGLTVRSADSNSVTVWIVNDKATRVEDAVYTLSLELPGTIGAEPLPVTPSRLPVLNPEYLPTGEDIEDISRIDAAGDQPGVVLVTGERGPSDAPVSWVYLMLEKGDSLELIRSAQGSPPGESVGNDGFEGAAVRRLGDGSIETFTCKERPAPTYILRERFAWNGSHYALLSGPDSLTLSLVGSQSAACIAGDGNELRIVDRSNRRIAVVGLGGDLLERGGNLDHRVLRWILFHALDRRLEGRSEEAPASLYGAVEAISEDAFGRIYLMTDNNEAGNSRLMVLRRK